MNKTLKLIPTIIGDQGNTPPWNCRCNYLSASILKLIHNGLIATYVRHAVMSQGNFIFKGQTGAIYSDNSSRDGNFSQINNVTYSVIGWLTHDSLAIEYIIDHPIVEHALRNGELLIFQRIIVNSAAGKVEIDIITPYIPGIKTAKAVLHRSPTRRIMILPGEMGIVS